MKGLKRAATAGIAAAGIAAGGLIAAAPGALAQQASQSSFIGRFHPPPSTVASTVPDNGDVNPYGVAVVPQSQGDLHRGDVLVSNFNNSANVQGTGTTIVEVPPGGGTGPASVFAQINAADVPGRARAASASPRRSAC